MAQAQSGLTDYTVHMLDKEHRIVCGEEGRFAVSLLHYVTCKNCRVIIEGNRPKQSRLPM